MPHRKALSYRAVSTDVRTAILALLVETGRLSSAADGAALVRQCPDRAWGERSAPSWAGFLKRVERALHDCSADYALLHVTATDGHRTWQLPLQVTVHLLAEKTISAHRGWLAGSARGSAARF